MDLDIYKLNLSPKQRKLFFAVENGTLTDVEWQYQALSKTEWNDKYLDYMLLVSALQRGHKSIIKFLMKNGSRMKIPMKTKIFCTPLYYAVELDDANIIRDLIKMGASISDRDKNEVSPFELAVQTQQNSTIYIILENLSITSQAKSFDPTNDIDVALFHMACWKGNSKLVKKFLDCNFPVNSISNLDRKEWSGFTPIHFALEGLNSSSVIKLLLPYDIDFELVDHRGKTPMHAAFSKRRYFELYSMMLGKYINDFDTRVFSNPVDENGLSHFHIICCGADTIDSAKLIAIVQYFIDNGVDINSCILSQAQNEAGYTALHYAVENMRLNVVELLLRNGADLKKGDAKGQTPLHLAIKDANRKTKAERSAIIYMLLEHGANVDAKDLQNSTPIHYALYRKYKEYHEKWTESDPFIQLLLSHSQLSADLTDDHGLSYLQIASSLDIYAVETLLKRGASVNSCLKSSNALYKSGYSALHFAVSCNKLKIVETLLNHGADPNIGIASDKKVTPLHVLCHYDCFNEFCNQFEPWVVLKDKTARQNQQIQSRTDRLRMMGLLLKRGAYANVVDSSGNTPLSHVCEMALDLGIKSEFKDQSDQKTILDEISIRQNLMIDMLMRYGANINPRTKAYASLLHLVARQCARPQRKNLAEILLKRGADVHSIDDSSAYTSSSTILHVAVKEFMGNGIDDGLIDLLFEYGADVNAKTPTYLDTPLHAAINYSSEYDSTSSRHERFAKILEKFLDEPSFDLDAQNYRGNTLLHIAVDHKDHRLIKTLLDAGAEVSIENSQKLSPIGSFYEHVKSRLSNTLHSGKDLDCFIVLIAHIHKLMITKSFLKGNLQEHFEKLSELYPEKSAAIGSSICNEVELMSSTKIDRSTSLFSILSKDDFDMAIFAKNENLKKTIKLPEFSVLYPLLGSLLIKQFRTGLQRNSILEDAKEAFKFVSGKNWPETCLVHIFKNLSNRDLRKIIKSKSVILSLKKARENSRMLNKRMPKIIRTG